jgi:hypothetical protein
VNTVYVDAGLSDDARRKQLYAGQLFVFPPRPSTLALASFARAMIEGAFPGLDPRHAQYHMPVERYVSIVAPLKPSFIHHPRTMELLRDVVSDLGCALDQTYIDVPRLRMVTSHGYLTSGVGYAHHPHRDTWYAAPMSQLNWWLPIYDIATENSMAFHPRYWDQAVSNSSEEFNYYRWNAVGRASAATQIHSDTRKQPKPLEPLELEPQIRVVAPAGSIVLFSAAQMHSTVANTSGVARYSIDFRTVHFQDVLQQRGAPNIDSRCTGTSLRDFRRGTDLERMPEEVARLYDSTASPDAVLVYRPDLAPSASAPSH